MSGLDTQPQPRIMNPIEPAILYTDLYLGEYEYANHGGYKFAPWPFAYLRTWAIARARVIYAGVRAMLVDERLRAIVGDSAVDAGTRLHLQIQTALQRAGVTALQRAGVTATNTEDDLDELDAWEPTGQEEA